MSLVAAAKALTVRQPWAWLIAHGGKDVENRTWSTSYRGPLLIHAAKGMTRAELWQAQLFVDGFDTELAHKIPPPEQLPFGAIVATAQLVDVIEPGTPRAKRWAAHPWYLGECGWVLEDITPLTSPIECSGSLGLWTPPPPVLARVQAGASPRLRVLCSCKRWLDWAALPVLGHQDDGVERLELKLCPHCGSTRARVLDPVHERLVNDVEPVLSAERDARGAA